MPDVEADAQNSRIRLEVLASRLESLVADLRLEIARLNDARGVSDGGEPDEGRS